LYQAWGRSQLAELTMSIAATQMSVNVDSCCCRVLKSDGLFVSVTFAQQHFRKPFLLLQEFSWNVSVSTFGEGFHYYVYTLHKGRRTETDHPVPFGWPLRDLAAPSGIADSTMQHDHMDREDYLLSVDL